MRRRRLSLSLGAILAVLVASASPAPAQQIFYMQICSLYGPGFYYIPGTDTCVHAVTGDTRRQTDVGTIRTWSPLVLNIIDQTAAADRAIQAAAVTMAIPMPIILEGDRFGLAGNWSFLSAGYHAFGFAGALALGNGLSLNAGVGVGVETLAIGTRFGLNFNW